MAPDDWRREHPTFADSGGLDPLSKPSFLLRGSIELEFGPRGRERLKVSAGDFAYVPRGVIHREGTTADEPGEIALVRVGSGAPVVNVEGPEPE